MARIRQSVGSWGSRRRWLAVFEAPQLRAYAELCNDPSGFEVRKHVIKAHEKTRRWDERVGAGTGSLGRGEGMRCSLAPSKLDFEPLQRRRSFLIDPVTSRANGQSLELQFVENIPTVCASARAPFPSAAVRDHNIVSTRRTAAAAQSGPFRRRSVESAGLSPGQEPELTQPHSGPATVASHDGDIGTVPQTRLSPGSDPRPSR